MYMCIGRGRYVQSSYANVMPGTLHTQIYKNANLQRSGESPALRDNLLDKCMFVLTRGEGGAIALHFKRLTNVNDSPLRLPYI